MNSRSMFSLVLALSLMNPGSAFAMNPSGPGEITTSPTPEVVGDEAYDLAGHGVYLRARNITIKDFDQLVAKAQDVLSNQDAATFRAELVKARTELQRVLSDYEDALYTKDSALLALITIPTVSLIAGAGLGSIELHERAIRLVEKVTPDGKWYFKPIDLTLKAGAFILDRFGKLAGVTVLGLGIAGTASQYFVFKWQGEKAMKLSLELQSWIDIINRQISRIDMATGAVKK